MSSPTTSPRIINPTCHACQGTGTDQAFGGQCSECERTGISRIVNPAEYGRDQIRPTGNGGHRLAGSGSPSSSVQAATEKQVAFLARLVAERDPSNAVVIEAQAALDRGTSKRVASGLIDSLMAMSRTATPAPSTRTTSPIRSNRYAGTCRTCGQAVEVEAGRIEKIDGRWATFHLDGECPEVEQTDASPVEGIDISGVPAGRYGIPGGDTRLKVQIDRPERGNWAGWTFIRDAAEYGQGRRYGKIRPGSEIYVGDIMTEMAAIAADPLAAAKRYGELTSRCCICNRKLEDEGSVAAGIGPVCARKFGA